MLHVSWFFFVRRNRRHFWRFTTTHAFVQPILPLHVSWFKACSFLLFYLIGWVLRHSTTFPIIIVLSTCTLEVNWSNSISFRNYFQNGFLFKLFPESYFGNSPAPVARPMPRWKKVTACFVSTNGETHVMLPRDVSFVMMAERFEKTDPLQK